MSIILQFFPNGEFSQGVDTSKKRRDKQRRDDLTQTLKLDPKRRDAYLQWIANNEKLQAQIDTVACGSFWVSQLGHRYEVELLKLDSCTLRWQDKRGKSYSTVVPQSFRATAFLFRLTPLVHQSVESCENAKTIDTSSSRKKLEGMTKNMARNIRNGVYLLEQQPGGKDCLSFLTLTLPNLSTDGLAQCCANWDYMVKRFLDWLRTRIEKTGFSFMYVYATEIQTKRLEKRHEYAPHLHLVFRGRNGKKSSWVITPKQARKAWGACIASVVNESFNRSALENLQRIRYSAARYLSKYLSKGKCKIPDKAAEYTISSLRTQWGGMAREISRAIKLNTYRIAGEATQSRMAITFISELPKLVELGLVRYFKNGFIPLGQCAITGLEYGLHVCCGCLSTPTFEGGFASVLGYISDRFGGY